MIVPSQVIEQALAKAIEVLIAKYDELGMRATGDWARGLEADAEINAGVIKGLPYTEQLVHGREPGKRPPIAPLERWAAAKFGLSGREATSMAYAVANKISERGTTWYQQGGSDLLEVLESPEVLNAFNDIVGDYIRVTIEEDLRRELKTLAA